MTLVLACLFVFLAGFNVWNMLTGRESSARSHRLWIQIHRGCGYAFTALFVIFCYSMLLRVQGMEDELPPRLILHVGLAIALGPLIFAKIIATRSQQASRGVLTALGIAIFTAAFTASHDQPVHALSTPRFGQGSQDNLADGGCWTGGFGSDCVLCAWQAT